MRGHITIITNKFGVTKDGIKLNKVRRLEVEVFKTFEHLGHKFQIHHKRGETSGYIASHSEIGFLASQPQGVKVTCDGDVVSFATIEEAEQSAKDNCNRYVGKGKKMEDLIDRYRPLLRLSKSYLELRLSKLLR